MIKAYVFEGTNLVERLMLRYPLKELHLAVKEEINISWRSGEDDIPRSALNKKTYPCLFMSEKKDVGIYSKEDAYSFMERALVGSPVSVKRQFQFSKYRVEAKITEEGADTIAKMVFDAIKLARKQTGNGGDGYIAEMTAKNIDDFFTRAL